MRLLLINPNTSQHVTERMVAQATASAAGRAAVVGATASFGPAIIGSRVENAIAAHGALDLAAREATDFDAIILGVSMDTALFELRELLPMPVVGMAQAGFLLGQAMGQRIGCLTIGAHMIPLYQEMTARYGFRDQAVWRAMDLPAAFGARPGPEVSDAVARAVNDMARNDRVDVVMLCGAVLTGYADKISADVPVIDCIDAATRLAITLVESAACHPDRHPVAKLSGRASTGLGPALSQLLSGAV